METPAFVNSPSELICRFGARETRINYDRIGALVACLFLVKLCLRKIERIFRFFISEIARRVSRLKIDSFCLFRDSLVELILFFFNFNNNLSWREKMHQNSFPLFSRAIGKLLEQHVEHYISPLMFSTQLSLITWIESFLNL